MDKDKYFWIRIGIVVLVLLFLFIRIIPIYGITHYDVYCEERFGKEHYYKPTPCLSIKPCVRECQKAVINETSGEMEIISKYFTEKQYKLNCKLPNIFDLKKWGVICEII